MTNLELENKTTVTQVAEQQTEIEHLKAELLEARAQYKETAQEVRRDTEHVTSHIHIQTHRAAFCSYASPQEATCNAVQT